MSDTGSHPIPGFLHPSPVEDAGGIEFDERGNAVWAPRSGVDRDDALRRLLDHPSLAVVPDAPGTPAQVAPNPKGLRGGYDPYDSGRLDRQTWKAKKDLRRLSDWIVNRRKTDPGRG
jgi:hypothetical protein